MVRKLFKNPSFLLGLSVIMTLLSWSFIHAFFFDNHIKELGVLFAEDGLTPLDTPPYPPSLEFPFGTDLIGFSLFDQMIIGAKYTIGFALLTGLVRVLVSLGFGICYGLYFERFRGTITNLLDVFNFIPVTLLAYFLLSPILIETPDGFAYSLNERILYELIILTIVAVPTTSILIGNELSDIYRKEFIEGAKVIWSGKLHILKKHILPHLLPKLWIIFMQQIINVLLILAHLGIFKMFFGGTNLTFGFGPKDPPTSISYEWSGLIGNYLRYINGYPWMAFIPILFFAITILAVNLMLRGIKSCSEGWQTPVVKRQRQEAALVKSMNIKDTYFVKVEPNLMGGTKKVYTVNKK